MFFKQGQNDFLRKTYQIRFKLMLADCYRLGIDIDHPETTVSKFDPYAIMNLYQEAAHLGSTRACFELGMIFMFGWPPFVEKGLTKAKYYFRKILDEEGFESLCDPNTAEKLFKGLYTELTELKHFKAVTEIFLKQISYVEGQAEYDKNILGPLLKPVSIAIIGAVLALICPELFDFSSPSWLGLKWLFEDLGLPIFDYIERWKSYAPNILMLYFATILETGIAMGIVHGRSFQGPYVHVTEYLAGLSGVIIGNLLVQYSELSFVKKIIACTLSSSALGALFSGVRAIGYLADPVHVEHMKQQEFDLFKGFRKRYYAVTEKDKNKQITKVTLETVANKIASLTNEIEVPSLLQLSLYAVMHYLHNGVILKEDLKKLPDEIRSKVDFKFH